MPPWTEARQGGSEGEAGAGEWAGWGPQRPRLTGPHAARARGPAPARPSRGPRTCAHTRPGTACRRRAGGAPPADPAPMPPGAPAPPCTARRGPAWRQALACLQLGPGPGCRTPGRRRTLSHPTSHTRRSHLNSASLFFISRILLCCDEMVRSWLKHVARQRVLRQGDGSRTPVSTAAEPSTATARLPAHACPASSAPRRTLQSRHRAANASTASWQAATRGDR